MSRFYFICFFIAVILGIVVIVFLKNDKLPKIKDNNQVEIVDNILVEKSKRKMYLRYGENVVRQYEISLGSNPIGAKHQQNDGKTPEGIYYISGRNKNSSYHLSLRISYPNDEDKLWAKNHNVSAGGDIMIHGFPNKAINALFKFIHKTDWTKGCIAVTDEEIEEIWQLVKDGTIINIKP